MNLSRYAISMPAANVGRRALPGLRIPHPVIRRLHTTPAYSTDGVYRDLTDMRVRTPWIDALRRKREDGVDQTKELSTPTTPSNRDLKPKRMSDSFHRVVSAASLYPKT